MNFLKVRMHLLKAYEKDGFTIHTSETMVPEHLFELMVSGMALSKGWGGPTREEKPQENSFPARGAMAMEPKAATIKHSLQRGKVTSI